MEGGTQDGDSTVLVEHVRKGMGDFTQLLLSFAGVGLGALTVPVLTEQSIGPVAGAVFGFLGATIVGRGLNKLFLREG